MRKIFLDCGAWKGNSTIHFIENCDDTCKYMIYAFECNSEIMLKMRKNIRKKGYGGQVEFIGKAVWDTNCIKTLKTGVNQYSESSSLLENKRIIHHHKTNDMKVECIDFSEWIKKHCKPTDHIVCKLNIEGAEYRVLNKMIGDGTIEWINELHVAWHWKKIRMEEEQHNILISQLERRKLKLHTWSLEHGR